MKFGLKEHGKWLLVLSMLVASIIVYEYLKPKRKNYNELWRMVNVLWGEYCQKNECNPK